MSRGDGGKWRRHPGASREPPPRSRAGDPAHLHGFEPADGGLLGICEAEMGDEWLGHAAVRVAWIPDQYGRKACDDMT